MHHGHALVRGLRENFDRKAASAEAGHGAVLDAARDLLERVRAAQRLDVLFEELIRARPRRGIGRGIRAPGSHRSARPGGANAAANAPAGPSADQLLEKY